MISGESGGEGGVGTEMEKGRRGGECRAEDKELRLRELGSVDGRRG